MSLWQYSLVRQGNTHNAPWVWAALIAALTCNLGFRQWWLTGAFHHCGREQAEACEELQNSPAPFQEKRLFKKTKMVLEN